MPINDTDLISLWAMSITRDPTPQLPSQSKAFQIAITDVLNGSIGGAIVPSGPPLSGKFQSAGGHTGQSVMSLQLNIDGTDIFLSGIVTKPGNFAQFDGHYHRLGVTALGDGVPFDPGETGTGGGSQTT